MTDINFNCNFNSSLKALGLKTRKKQNQVHQEREREKNLFVCETWFQISFQALRIECSELFFRVMLINCILKRLDLMLTICSFTCTLLRKKERRLRLDFLVSLNRYMKICTIQNLAHATRKITV